MKIRHLLILIFFSGVFVYSQSNITYDGSTGIEIQAGADVCADAIIINGTYTGGGTICQGPLPVTISSFEARVTKNNVRLIWVTEIETNNSGFEIERLTLSGVEGWKKISFIPGSGTTNSSRIYNYEDNKLAALTYKYRLKQIDYNSNFEYFELQNDVVVKAPAVFSISQNYPNPSNPKSRIDYQIPFMGKVSLKIYDLLGKEVSVLVNDIKDAGYFTAEFDGSNLSSGVYFYRITVEGEDQKFIKTLKMILVK